MRNKKGFQLAVNTVVIMILAIVVLLFLIGFFMLGSGSFMDKIKGYFSYSNVDSIRQGCEVLVNSGQINSFCCDVKTVRYYDDGKQEGELSCKEMVDLEIIELNELDCSEVDC